MKRLSLIAVALAALCLGTTGQALADRFEDILKNGVVRIGVPLDVPPFGSVNAQRTAEGFDIDLANMVGKALGVKVIVPSPFSSAVLALALSFPPSTSDVARPNAATRAAAVRPTRPHRRSCGSSPSTRSLRPFRCGQALRCPGCTTRRHCCSPTAA